MADETQFLTLDRGQTVRLVICASELNPTYRIVGLDDADITVTYQQHLARCSMEEDTPGLYLTLAAGEAAISSKIDVVSATDSGRIFASLSIDVPERIVISEASFGQVDSASKGLYLLEIGSGEDLDLSSVRADDMSFPKGPWPTMRLLRSDEVEELPNGAKPLDRPVIAEATRLRAMIKVDGQQRMPATVVLSNVKKDGIAAEAVAHPALPTPYWATSMKSDDAKFVDVRGVRTRYFDKGAGDAMLLVHGGQAGSAGFAAWSWLPNFDSLSENFRVLALDRIGQGYTDNPTSKADYENYYQTVVDHVFGFIKALELNDVHLVGHSQGGWPVTRIALDYPDLVKSLTIVDSATAAPADREGGSVNFYGYLSRFIHSPDGETAESVLRELNMYSYTGNNITEAQVARLLDLAKLPKMAQARAQLVKHRMNPAHPTYRALKAALHNDIEEGKLKVPTLIVWGRNDPEGSYPAGVKLFELMSAHADDVQFHTFDEAGHLPSKEYPDEFNRLVTAFAIGNQ